LRDIQQVMTALRSPVRREILRLLWEGELPAGEIAAAFSLTAPTISQHLAVLRRADLVELRRSGTSRLYRARRKVLQGLHGALEDPGKWLNADDIPERALSDTRTGPVVIASVDVPTDQASTFAAFTDPAVYSRWLGVPVTIKGGRFACTLEWGTEVRGRYEIVSPPSFLAMRWDFDDDNVPIPGGEMTCYLWVRPNGAGSTVEVHQLIATAAEAEFMEGAWAMVLGRLKTGVVAALEPGSPLSARSRRTKSRRPA
jgi:DNA-binding transcriptional ArsR family regulator/uncharacterized protein YndB with AHSA1/START domain